MADIGRFGEPDVDHPSWFEIADAMYLAEFIGQPAPTEAPRPAGDPAVRSTTPVPDRSPRPQTAVDPGLTARSQRQPPLVEQVVVAPHSVESRVESGEQIRVDPLRPVLDVPGIVRGLRPLRRQVQSWRANDIVLDEDATAERAVQNELWLPLIQRATERWLDLTLVVDSGPSMALWRTKINAFEALMRRLGIFRTVQRRSLDAGETGPVLRGGTPTAPERSLGELLDPSGRRVVLVVTDGVSKMWRSPNVAAMLARLGCAMPTALVHMLPQRVWRQTGLNLHRVHLRPQGRLVPNNRWSVDLLDHLLDDPEPSSSAPIPVLEMEGRWLGRLAHVLIGRDEPVPAAVLMAREHSELPFGTDWLSPSEQVSDFLATASPAAFRLATLLAAVPVNLRTVCRIQAEVVPEARVEHIAEVLCSPLFEPHPHAHADSPWEKISFTVDPEVRKELLSSARRSETARVVRMTSSYGRIWKALDAPDSTDLVPPAADNSDVVIERIVMEALSGPYLAHAERLRTTVPLVDNTSSGDDPIVAGPTPLVDRPTGGSPQIWGDVPQRNPAFVGRTDLLNALDAQLAADVPVALYGWSGAGKTQIAIEYIYRHIGDYELVWWIDATSATRIRAALVLGDFPNEQFAITRPANSDIYGNPRMALGLPRDQVPAFYRDFLNKPQALNHNQTMHGYWMEDSGGRIGVNLDSFGVYRLAGKKHEYGLNEWGAGVSCPAGDNCNRDLRTDLSALWKAEQGPDVASKYDVIFYQTAGNDESSTWQEFGEMKFADCDHIPAEFGPPDPALPRCAKTRYVPWTSWAAAANHWPNASGNTTTQAESSGLGTFSHELSHVFGIGDNYNNPYGTPARRASACPRIWICALHMSIHSNDKKF
ncbi:SAV_2336 N-terminal domain-related protein [Kibdelosporangium lantanae]|uniref:SAV_2336 N-terminal domain-related protein n=1 Tax=Kibdelosporangium lantanae TaxID=1497396 RepID=A0ABW3M0Y1_9PSEU